MNLQSKLEASRDFPIELHIEPTNHCNKACYMCPTKERYIKDIMPLGVMYLEIYETIIDECAKYHDNMEINLHKDGEPLLHPDLDKMILYAKEKGFFTHFATNGLLLDKWKEKLVDSGLDLLTISSIDWSAMKDIRAFMKYKGLGKKPITQIKMFRHMNIEVPVRVDKLIYRPMHKWTDGQGQKEPCNRIKYSMAVNWDGGIDICCVDYKRKCVLGNIKEKSIHSIWNKEIKEIVSQQEKGIFKPPCNTCGYIDITKKDVKLNGSKGSKVHN